jgi:hypothetical protein
MELIWFLGATEKFKITDISMIYLRMILVRYILEIADADFYVEVTR